MGRRAPALRHVNVGGCFVVAAGADEQLVSDHQHDGCLQWHLCGHLEKGNWKSRQPFVLLLPVIFEQILFRFSFR